MKEDATTLDRRARFRVLQRDGHRCQFCGRGPNQRTLDVTLLVPIELGGEESVENSVTACVDCIEGKAAVPVTEIQAQAATPEAIRWSAAIGETARERRRHKVQMDAAVNEFDKAWQLWSRPNSDTGVRESVPREANWRASIDRFVAEGLSAGELKQTLREVMQSQLVSPSDVWRQFRRQCWSEIRKRQARAVEVAEDTEKPIRALTDEETVQQLLGELP